MDTRWMTAGIALALGLAWTASPALAQSTTEKIERKAERATDKVTDTAKDIKDKITGKEDDPARKAERAAEKAERKADRAAERAEEKAEKAADKADSKMDRARDKAGELKDRAAAKMDRMNTKAHRAEVTEMQKALKEQGHDPGPIDGVMGPRTRAALRDYQRKEGLTATGDWNAETATKLGVRMSSAETTDPAASPGTPSVPPRTEADKTTPNMKPRRPAAP